MLTNQRASSLTGVYQTSEGGDMVFIRRIVMATVVLYALHALYAVVVQRHLYGDAAWFLVRMMSEGKPTNFYSDFSHEFYYSRVVAYWLTQMPTVIAGHLGVSDARSLSWVFGATYFSHRLISLAICWRMLGRDEKGWIVLPLLGLFAGTIVSDVYIVTEIHISTSFLWPIAIALLRNRPLSSIGEWGLTAAILLASFTYESWAFFAPLLLLATLVRRTPIKADGRRFSVKLIIALAFCAAINWCAILFPRDPANKDGFVRGTLQIVTDLLKGVPSWHICAMVALAASGAAFLIIAWPMRVVDRRRTFLAGAVALSLAVLPPLHFLYAATRVDLSYAVTERGFAGLVMQVIWLAIFIIALHFRPVSRPGALRAVAILALGVALGQVAWQVQATHAWANGMTEIRQAVNQSSGSLPCLAIDAHAEPGRHPMPSSIMCTWWSMPLSLLQAPARQISTLLVLHDQWQPFDPYNKTNLPGRANGTFDYTRYLDARSRQTTIAPGEVHSFSTEGKASEIIGNGFTYPAADGSWTSGQAFDLHLCLPHSTRGYRASFDVGVADSLGSQANNLAIGPMGRSTIAWDLTEGQQTTITRELDLPSDTFDAQGCVAVHGRFEAIPPTPAELGIRADPRHLGLRFSSLRVTPL